MNAALALLAAASLQPDGPQTAGCHPRERGLVRIKTQLFSDDGLVGVQNGTGFVVMTDGVARVVTAAHVVSADPPDSPSRRPVAFAAWGCAPTDWRPLDIETNGLGEEGGVDLAVLKFRAAPPEGMQTMRVVKPSRIDDAYALFGYPQPERDSDGAEGLRIVHPGILEERMKIDRNFPSGFSGSPLRNANGDVVGVAVNNHLSEGRADVLMLVARNSWVLENGGLGRMAEEASTRPVAEPKGVLIDISYNSVADSLEAAVAEADAPEAPELWFSLTNLEAAAVTVTNLRISRSTRGLYKSVAQESLSSDSLVDLGVHAVDGPNVHLNPDRTFPIDGGKTQGFRVKLNPTGLRSMTDETKRDLASLLSAMDFTKSKACEGLRKRIDESDYGDWKLILRYVSASGRAGTAEALIFDYPLKDVSRGAGVNGCTLD